MPALHRDHFVVDVECQLAHKPASCLAEGEAMAHRQAAGTDEAFPAGA